MSDVDLLRRAAALMRERAEAATVGPWWAEGAWFHGDVPWPIVGHGSTGADVVAHTARRDGSDAENIASWDPSVALLVADSVDLAADWTEEHPGSWPPWCKKALAVARAYLREA